MIIGTAGHIDHGKTTLVRALTGVNTDRLSTEKERGISIELGYAYLPVPDTEAVLGFIDVPGHEALVHTMVAGATGMEFALLVIAADDGVMPQTREHIAILELLGVQRGCIVITKVDRADDEAIAQVQAQVAAVLEDTFLAGAPVFLVDSTDSSPASGLNELKAHLFAQYRDSQAAQTQVPFRLAIDRSFTLPGHGTVVTGTVFGGAFHLQDSSAPALTLMPGEQAVRVRRIHAQDRPSQSALAGQRCALNIVGWGAAEISRGQWLSEWICFEPRRRLAGRFSMWSTSQTELRLSYQVRTDNVYSHLNTLQLPS